MASKKPKKNERLGVDSMGRSPLHYAALERDVAKVKQLLTEGADPNAADDNRWTPLHFAAQSNAAEVALLLLEKGAAVDAKDSNGNTPLFRAVFASKGAGDTIKLLRAHGADSLVENAHGVSPLKLARTIANFDVAQYFADIE